MANTAKCRCAAGVRDALMVLSNEGSLIWFFLFCCVASVGRIHSGPCSPYSYTVRPSYAGSNTGQHGHKAVVMYSAAAAGQ